MRDYVKFAVRLFFMGVIAGIILSYLMKNRLQTDVYILNEEWLATIQNGMGNSRSLFVYVLFKRMREMGLILLISTTFAGLIFLYGYTGIMGIGTGIFMGTACLRYGLRGLIIFLTASFPQGILYIPGFLYLFHLCYLVCVKLYFPGRDYFQSEGSIKKFLIKNFFSFIILFFIVITGIILESYVNPKIFFSYIKNF